MKLDQSTVVLKHNVMSKLHTLLYRVWDNMLLSWSKLYYD